MCLIHIQPIHAQLFKGHHVVFPMVGLQFLQPGFQLSFCAFQLLDAETLAVVGLHFLNAQGDFLDLILQQTLLPFKGNGDALKLAVADDHGVIIAGGDPGAELFTVGALKIPFGRDQDIGGGIQAQELAGPLLRQMVRHHEHGLLA